MNVRGFRDLNANQNNRGGAYRAMNSQISDAIPFMSTQQQPALPPLQQTIPYTLKTICCPTLKLLSISVIFSIIIVIIYAFCLSQGITKQNKNILEVSPQVLIDYGAIQDVLVRKWQVWRLLTASFLHANLLHILMNLICFVFLLSRLQKTYNFKNLLGILVISAISGNILSVLCNKPLTVSCGASGIIFGVIGTYLAFMTINWATLGRYGEVRSQICCTVGVLVFFSTLFSFGSDVDMYGHFGGMIGGYFVALALVPGIQQKDKKFYIAGCVGLGLYFVGTFLGFFL